MQAYEGWLSQMGGRIQVIHLATQRERWILRDGVPYLDKNPVYTVTYKETGAGQRRTEGKQCLSCGAVTAPELKFCEMCGAPLFRPAPPDGSQ